MRPADGHDGDLAGMAMACSAIRSHALRASSLRRAQPRGAAPSKPRRSVGLVPRPRGHRRERPSAPQQDGMSVRPIAPVGPGPRSSPWRQPRSPPPLRPGALVRHARPPAMGRAMASSFARAVSVSRTDVSGACRPTSSPPSRSRRIEGAVAKPQRPPAAPLACAYVASVVRRHASCARSTRAVPMAREPRGAVGLTRASALLPAWRFSGSSHLPR